MNINMGSAHRQFAGGVQAEQTRHLFASRRARASIAAAMALLCASALALTAGIAPASATSTNVRCGVATQINLRGSLEAAGTGTSNSGRTYASGGTGSTLNDLINTENADPNFPVYQEAIAYPATILDVANPASTFYVSSVQTGVNNLYGEINSLVSDCPYTNILLAGYSQGADVIENLVGAYHMSGLSVPSLSATAYNRITAVVLFGDPSYRPGEVWDAAGNGTGTGIVEKPAGQLVWDIRYGWVPPSYTTQAFMTNVRSYCFTGDEFCQTNLTPTGNAIHNSYAGSTVIDDAWVYERNWMTNFG